MELLRAEARDEINETGQDIEEKIDELLTLLRQDKELYIPPNNDIIHKMALRCLRTRKFDVEKAAELVKKSFHLKHDYGSRDLWDKLIPSKCVPIFRSKVISVLNCRDKFGRHVFIARVEKWNPHKTTFEELLISTAVFIDELLTFEDTQLLGISAILDLKTLNFFHAKRVTPSRIHVMSKIVQDSFPARFKAFHIIHNSSLFSMLFSIAKPFLKEKIRKRIHFHGQDLQSLHSTINVDPELLPEFLGGKLMEDEYSDEEIWNSVIKKDEYYEELTKYGYVKKPKD